MKTSFKSLLSIGGVVLLGSAASADVRLFSYGVNRDGTVADSLVGDPLPPGTSLAGFDTTTGLGSVTMTFSTPGSHFAGLFVDHELSEALNTYFNEYGDASGTPGLSWEIDEPGFVFGDIWTNFSASDASGSALDNSNGVPVGSPDDVSMALGWNFSLAAGETGVASFTVSETAPSAGFYLAHFDPDSDEAIYFYSNLRVTGGPGPGLPDGTLPWVEPALALGVIAGLRRWASRRAV